MTLVSTVQAEVKVESYSVSASAGGYLFEGNEGLKDTYTAGLRAGYNFTENWGVEGFLNYVPTSIKDDVDADVRMIGYGIEGIYHFMPESKIVPFVAVSVGGIYYNTPAGVDAMSKFAVDYGAGIKYFLTDDIALRADVRHIIPLNNTYNDLLCTLGIYFSFGGKEKEVVPGKAKVEEPPAPKVAEAKIEEKPAPMIAEAKVEEPPALKVAEVKV
jgi:OOP family OmpA-OmpF porin